MVGEWQQGFIGKACGKRMGHARGRGYPGLIGHVCAQGMRGKSLWRARLAYLVLVCGPAQGATPNLWTMGLARWQMGSIQPFCD